MLKLSVKVFTFISDKFLYLLFPSFLAPSSVDNLDSKSIFV